MRLRSGLIPLGAGAFVLSTETVLTEPPVPRSVSERLWRNSG